MFWTQGAKVFLHWCKQGLHRCKTGFGWCKRLLGDLCSLGPKHLLHPLLTTFGKFPFSGPLPEHWGRKDSIAEGGIALICLVFIGYRASIAEIPLLRGGGGIAPPLLMLSKGETLRKGGGGMAPNWPC